MVDIDTMSLPVRGKCVKTVVVLLKYGANPNLRNDVRLAVATRLMHMLTAFMTAKPHAAGGTGRCHRHRHGNHLAVLLPRAAS